ncbi:MAG: outer membrane protein assembly factor BamB [Pseudomonadota bacterium]|nr:outer membrane protein assembly factor BamB [Pseudomonadota bacterium]
MNSRFLLRGTLLAATLLLGSCSLFSAIGGVFKDDEDEDREPMKLAEIDEEVQLRRQWSVNVGDGQGDKFNRLQPVLAGGRIYAASNDGRVYAVDAETGRTVWRQRIDDLITGGVGFGNNIVLVGTENSGVVAFAADSGEILWEATVSSEVLSAPVTNGRVVVVQSVDDNITGLNANNGQQLWIYESTVPELSVRGTSGPRIVDNFVLAAFANGAVVSVAVDNGTLRWEQRIAVPTGRSELDRLVDIDGELAINDAGLLLVPTYQGYLTALDVVTGQPRWRVEESSNVGAGFGFGNIYAVNVDGYVRAYRTNQETPMWENADLLRRSLTSPLGFSNYVAVGDFEGYLHLLSQVDGRLVGRVKVDGDGIRARALNAGNTLYVYGNSGTLAAYRVQ